MKCEMCHTEIRPSDLVCVRCGLVVPDQPLRDPLTASPAVHAVTPLKPALEDEHSPIAVCAALAFVLRRILDDVPTSRDWLDPLLENQARAVLEASDSMLRARKGGV